jgi:sugar phosphate isomerase/epimerase
MSTEPKYAVNAWSTPHNSVLDDIEQIARTGGKAIGFFEGKFEDGRDTEYHEAMKAHGLTGSFHVPRVWTILPVPFNKPGLETDPKWRTEQICLSIPRLAKLEPAAIIVGPGVSGDPARPAGPIEAVAEGLAQVADVAAEYDVPISFELLAHRRGSPLGWLPDIVAFLDEVGKDNVGVFFDVFHSWSEEHLHDHIREYGHRINGVHVNDVRVEERSNFDREYPGDGRGVAPEIIASLIEAGYDSWWELELFSDDGTFGNALPDSLWAIPHEEMLARAKEKFDEAWAAAQQILARRATA